MNYRTDLILGEAFYMFIVWSSISQILDFLYGLAFLLNPTQFTRTPITVCNFSHISPLNEMILDISAVNTDTQIIRRPWHISLVSAYLLGAAAIRLKAS